MSKIVRNIPDGLEASYADIKLDTIADLVNLTGTTPEIVWVSGYHTKGDGSYGSHILEWDPNSTEPHNGGTIIELGATFPTDWSDQAQLDAWFGYSGGTTGRYKLRYDDVINVKWFNNNFNKALSVGNVMFYGTVQIRETIKMPSKRVLMGVGKQSIIDGSLISDNIIENDGYTGGSINGQCVLKNFTILGDSTTANQCGIVLHDYYSTISDVQIFNCLGHSLYATEKNKDGDTPSGSLVNNIFRSIRTSNCGGVQIGDGLNKMTDYTFDNAIISVHNNTNFCLDCQVSAGAFISKIHTEGYAPLSRAINISYSYATKVHDIYIEACGPDGGMAVSSAQTSVMLDNVYIKNYKQSSKSLIITKSAAISHIDALITNLAIESSTYSVIGVYTENEVRNLKFINKSYIGDIQDSLHITTSVVSIEDTQILNGNLNDTVLNGLQYNGSRIPMVTQFTHNGNTAYSTSIPIKLNSYNFAIYDVMIYGNRYNAGGMQASALYNVCVSAKVNGTDSWTVFSDQVKATVGFSSDPTFTVSDNGDGTGEMTIAFTFSDATTTGICTIQAVPTTK